MTKSARHGNSNEKRNSLRLWRPEICWKHLG